MYSNMMTYENIYNCLRAIQQNKNMKLKSLNCWQQTSLRHLYGGERLNLLPEGGGGGVHSLSGVYHQYIFKYENYENIYNCLRAIQQNKTRKLKSANCWQQTSLRHLYGGERLNLLLRRGGGYFRNFITGVCALCGQNLEDTPYPYLYKAKPKNYTY